MFSIFISIEALTHGEKIITNQWFKKHRDFLRSHDIRLKTVTLQGYVSSNANTSFVTFFILNARALLSVRIKFFDKKLLTTASVEQHKKKFQVDLRASDRARLLFTTACHHGPVEFPSRGLDFMDQTDPFDCDCRKLWLS